MSAAFGTGNLGPDAVMEYALPDLLGIEVDMASLQQRRDRLLRALRDAGYEVDTPEGTFYLLVRSPIEDDYEFVRGLAKEHVFVMPGTMFELPGHFRISITATDDMVDRALPVFERAIKG
jgi:aspartate aminotransferase